MDLFAPHHPGFFLTRRIRGRQNDRSAIDKPGPVPQRRLGGCDQLGECLRVDVIAKGGGYEIQINAVGPTDITYVKPADDPRRR